MTIPEGAVAVAGNEPALAPVPARPVLELWDITKRWPRMSEPVLDRVDLLLEPGTTTVIGGRNGIGKTTLMRIAAGLIRPDEGIVILDDLHPVRDRREYQTRQGFVSAGNGGLYARFSVRRHLDFWTRLAFIPKAGRAKAIKDALTRFELEELAERRVDRMSMGQRQRLRLAGAFLHDPDLVLLDEPRNSLDADGVEILNGAIREVVGRGGAVLWCAPTGEEERIDSDYHLVLEAGKLAA